MTNPNVIDFTALTADNWEHLTGATDDDCIDIAFGIYIFASDHHSGQWSTGYQVLCALDCNYRDNQDQIIRGDIEDPSGEWDGACQVYQDMKSSKWAEKF